MLMESAPGLVNWHPYNKVKRPGVHKLACLQAIACGSDTAQYFQWRKGRGSFEQYHGAVVDHLGKDDTRIFREVAEVGALLKKIAPAAGAYTKRAEPRHLLPDHESNGALTFQKVHFLAVDSTKYDNSIFSQVRHIFIEIYCFLVFDMIGYRCSKDKNYVNE